MNNISQQKMNTHAIKWIAKAGLLCAISIVLVALVHFPIFPSATFLEYDPADIPILLGSFIYGPFTGLLMTIVSSGIQALTVSSKSGIMGFLMHVIATGTLVLVSGLIYKKFKTIKGAITGLIAGAVAMTAIMIPLNLILTPIFMGAPVAAVIDLLPVIILFNAIKSLLNISVTFLLYKRIGKYFK